MSALKLKDKFSELECYYRFDEKSSTFPGSNKWDRSTLPLQLFTHIIGVQLKEGVVVIEECYQYDVCWQVKGT